jgi:indole-3-glycerol phosphate synthase
MTILDKIIKNKKKELEVLATVSSIGDMEKSRLFKRETVSLSEFLLDTDRTGIIAEFKRKSPSKGVINSSSSVVEVACGYFSEGACGVSVLTDHKFFGGSPFDLMNAREKSNFPILRKDFILDEYQVIESKAIGADAVLLIAAILENQEVLNLSRLAHSLGLEILLEVHEQNELDKVNQYINIIGINNRNFRTFEVNTDVSEKIAHRIPPGFLSISESGISSPQTIKTLKTAGYNGFLIGEKFMSTSDPVQAFAEFVKELK